LKTEGQIGDKTEHLLKESTVFWICFDISFRCNWQTLRFYSSAVLMNLGAISYY